MLCSSPSGYPTPQIISTKYPQYRAVPLLAMHKQPATNRLLRPLRQLLPSALLQASKDQLRLERPLERDAPDLAGLLLGERVVVLQVGAEPFGFQRRPRGVLVHGARVLRPVRELVGVHGEFRLQVLDGLGVFVEEDLGGGKVLVSIYIKGMVFGSADWTLTVP